MTDHGFSNEITACMARHIANDHDLYTAAKEKPSALQLAVAAKVMHVALELSGGPMEWMISDLIATALNDICWRKVIDYARDEVDE